MKRTNLITIAVLYLALFGFYAQANGQVAVPIKAAEVSVKAEKFLRSELYFGRSKPGGGLVSDEDWRSFLADTVTPRFPDGFTVLAAVGQYREKSGKVITEPSQVLILLYSKRSKKVSRAKIEEIRAAYIKRFDQESVLRVDLPRTVNVSF
jgi:hypothetical protein